MSSDLKMQPERPLSGKPLHVLTLTPFYPSGDDDAQGGFVAEPLAWTSRLGVRNTVLAVRPFYAGRARAVDQSAIRLENMRFLSLPSGWGLSTAGWFLFGRILPVLRRWQSSDPIDIIHAHSALPCGHAAWLLGRELGIPFVVTVHGLDAYSTRQVSGSAGKGCSRISQRVYGSARAVICVSAKVQDQVTQGSTNRIPAEVIYNGVDPEIFFPPKDEPAETTILSVGNLIPTKGHECLLRAVAGLVPQFPNVSLEIVGEGPEHDRLQKLATELAVQLRTRFLGRQRRAQVAAAMRRAAIFALPSRYEALGCVYLEAMASGRPVVGCRGQGIEEVITPGRDGYLVEPGDMPGLLSALTELLEQASWRRKLGTAARQTIMNGYTLAQQATRLLDLYEECRK